MLKGISKIVSPELVKVLCEMGHGDEIVIADGNFPSENFGKRVQIFFSYKLIGELTGAIESAVTSAVEMEQKFAEIQAITTATDGEMNKLSNSINLNDEIVDSKTKYAKAMNDFITNKDKAIGRKLEIAKLMTEVLKFNGNVSKTFAESEAVGDWSEFMSMVNKDGTLNDNKKEEEKLEYTLK